MVYGTTSLELNYEYCNIGIYFTSYVDNYIRESNMDLGENEMTEWVSIAMTIMANTTDK